MDLQKDLIPKKHFQKLLVGFMCFTAIFIIWSGIDELNSFHSVFDADEVKAGETLNYTMEPLSFTKVNLDGTTYTYISVTDLSYRPLNHKATEILSSALENTKALGLLSHPSFLVKEADLPFWKSQFQLTIGLTVFGWVIFIGFLIGMSITITRQQQKLFTREIYHWVLGLYFLIFAGFLVHPILYGRMIHFLNTEFYLGEPLTSGISPEPMLGLGVLLFLVIFLEKAVPMQNEQDLTV